MGFGRWFRGGVVPLEPRSSSFPPLWDSVPWGTSGCGCPHTPHAPRDSLVGKGSYFGGASRLGLELHSDWPGLGHRTFPQPITVAQECRALIGSGPSHMLQRWPRIVERERQELDHHDGGVVARQLRHSSNGCGPWCSRCPSRKGRLHPLPALQHVPSPRSRPVN